MKEVLSNVIASMRTGCAALNRFNSFGVSVKGHSRLCLAAMVTAAAVTFSAAPATASDVIAFSVSGTSNPFYARMAQGVQDEAQALGYEAVVLDAQGRADKQVSDAEDALQRAGLKALLVNGVDAGSIRVFEMAKEKGLPTFMLQRDYGEDVATSFIGTDNEEVGRIMAQWFADLHDGQEPSVLFITGTPGAASSEDRIRGFESVMANYPNIDIVAKQSGYYDRARALGVVENLLQRHPDVDAILCLNDEMAMGAVAAVRAQGKSPMIVGIDGNDDALRAIDAGQLHASIVISPYDIGRAGVRSADAVIKGGSVPARQIAEVTPVTKENVSDFIQ